MELVCSVMAALSIKLWEPLNIQSESSCEGFFRQMKQKTQGILCVFPRLFVIYYGNKTRGFDRD